MADTFPALLERLYREQFTGPVTLYFGQGVPTDVEFPATAARIRLDKAPKGSAELTHSLGSRPVSRGSDDAA